MKITFITPITTSSQVNKARSLVAHLKDSLESVASQTVPYWEYLIVCEKKLFTKELHSLCQIYQKNRHSIKILTTKSSNSAYAANIGLKHSSGEFVALINPGDILRPIYTFMVIKSILENKKVEFIYPDQDYINDDGVRHSPYIKPNISPDLLLCNDYIGSVSVIKKSLLKSLKGWNQNFKIAYSYCFNLRALQTCLKMNGPDLNFRSPTSKIFHLNEILYSQRANITGASKKNQDAFLLKSPTFMSKLSKKENIEIIENFIKKNNLPISETTIINNLYFRHNWTLRDEAKFPLASIIIPTRNGYKILKKCIDSIINKTSYKNYEIIIVDNESSDTKTIDYINAISKKYNIKKINYPGDFNYSAINNYAVKNSSGSIIVFLNNDTEVISKNWLQELIANALRKEIGCVGVLLYYPDKTIQHAGTVVGLRGVADHAFKGLKKSKRSNYFGYFDCLTNPEAVTAAAMAIKKKLFTKLGGFDSRHLKIAFNDTDLCLKAQQKGYRNLLIPYIELIHHESKSRVPNDLQSEKDYLRKKWIIPYQYDPNNKIINYP